MPKANQEEAKQQYQNGKLAYEKGDFEEALTNLNNALQYYLNTTEHILLADLLRILGEIYYTKGLYIESRNHYKRAFLSFKNYNQKIGMADCYDKVALSFMVQGELQHAEDYQEKALEIRKQTPDKRGTARALKNLAIIKYQLTNDDHKMLALLEEAIEIARKSKDPQLMVNLYLDKLKIQMKINSYEEAMHSIVIARRLSKKFNIKLPDETEDDFSDILLFLGMQSYDKGDKDQALKYLKNAVAILKSRNKPIIESVESIIIKLENK